MSRKHMGSSIDDFLKDEGIFEKAQAQAINAAMKEKKISKNKMATMLKTSRSQVGRLLDPKNDMTLGSLHKAAALLGRA